MKQTWNRSLWGRFGQPYRSSHLRLWGWSMSNIILLLHAFICFTLALYCRGQFLSMRVRTPGWQHRHVQMCAPPGASGFSFRCCPPALEHLPLLLTCALWLPCVCWAWRRIQLSAASLHACRSGVPGHLTSQAEEEKQTNHTKQQVKQPEPPGSVHVAGSKARLTSA